MVTREQAWIKLNELVKNPNLVKHCLAVELAMLGYFDYFYEVVGDSHLQDVDREKWGIAGLVHDADWEAFPDSHPKVIVDWLKDKGADSDVINAVAAHGWEFGVEAEFLISRTLRAVDELTGLIVAVALVKDKRLANVTVSSVMKKWNKKDFARGAKREDVEKGANDLNISLEKHVEIVLEAMKKGAVVLGLG